MSTGASTAHWADQADHKWAARPESAGAGLVRGGFRWLLHPQPVVGLIANTVVRDLREVGTMGKPVPIGQRPNDFKFGMAIQGVVWPPGPIYFISGGGGHGLSPRCVRRGRVGGAVLAGLVGLITDWSQDRVGGIRRGRVHGPGRRLQIDDANGSLQVGPGLWGHVGLHGHRCMRPVRLQPPSPQPCNPPPRRAGSPCARPASTCW